MRVLLWHGWLLDGAGSNVYTARVAEDLSAAGNEVVLLCQEPHPERYAWIDAAGTASTNGVADVRPIATPRGAGSCVLLRPDIGRLLPVFVLDEYAGFDVRRFVDLDVEELERYLAMNVGALRAAAAWHRPDVVIAGHAIPGGPIARRALGSRSYVVKIHGSDVEYAMRPQRRYQELAREGLIDAVAVAGASGDVLHRCAEFVPGIEALSHVVHPGVDAERFRPRESREALIEALDELAHRYDQTAPDPDAARILRRLAAGNGPLVGYFGKLIPQKGVDLMLAALTQTRASPDALVIGFGLERERLAALWTAL
jgi:glycosyltransferase involved in cell wall biosynthesis